MMMQPPIPFQRGVRTRGGKRVRRGIRTRSGKRPTKAAKPSRDKIQQKLENKWLKTDKDHIDPKFSATPGI